METEGSQVEAESFLEHSAATTEEYLSPRPDAGLGDDLGTLSKWQLVRRSLVNAAQDGDHILNMYGDMITNKVTIERFLHAAKGNPDKAAEQLHAHLRWRCEYGWVPPP